MLCGRREVFSMKLHCPKIEWCKGKYTGHHCFWMHLTYGGFLEVFPINQFWKRFVCKHVLVHAVNSCELKLVGGLEHLDYFSIRWESSSQLLLTPSFFRLVYQPPTGSTSKIYWTNQSRILFPLVRPSWADLINKSGWNGFCLR